MLYKLSKHDSELDLVSTMFCTGNLVVKISENVIHYKKKCSRYKTKNLSDQQKLGKFNRRYIQ